MPLRVALLGFGLAGRVFHGPLLAAEPGFEIAVIATGDPARQAEARRRHPDADVVDSAEEALARAHALDLVVVATPPATHVPLATAALDAGLAVVVDKPLSATAHEAAALVEHAEAGGVVYDLGSHLIDQVIQLLGAVDDVHAELASYSGGASPDDGFLSLRHVGGAVSRLWTSKVAGASGPRFRVLGSDGAFMSWALDPQEEQLAAGMAPNDSAYGLPARDDWPVVGVTGAAGPVPPERGDYPAFYRGVAEGLRDGAPMPVDARDAVEVAGILERAHSTWTTDALQ